MKLHTTVILVIVWLGVFAVHKAEGSVASQSMRKLSCVNLSAQKVDIRSIVNYERQKVPVEAIMYQKTLQSPACRLRRVQVTLPIPCEAVSHLLRRVEAKGSITESEDTCFS
uniref:Chemokine interleukin-8-like domain-containing protein n=1 Tax=Pavo cristatus TaxID=9049 RepID=A0A8C9FQP1_PAVCR